MSRHVFDASAVARLDQAIAAAVPSLSRRRARALIDQGSVLIDGARVRAASRSLRPGQRVEVYDDVVIASVDIPVLCDDDGVVIVDKPAGLAVEPTRQAAVSVIDHLRRQGRALHAVHRLDVDTSGVLVLADAHRVAAWSKVFHDGAVERGYMAAVSGVVVDDEGVIDAPLLPPDRTGRARIAAAGKASRTRFVVHKRGALATLLEVTPETGRTHQIRVHLAHLGHPLLGDRRYGHAKADVPHLGLHARSLRAVIDGRAWAIAVEPPPAFAALLHMFGLAPT